MIPLPPAPIAAPPPAQFVAEQSATGAPLRSVLVLRSARTGRVTRRLGSFGEAFTNNGLAVTRDLGAVFYTLAPRRGQQGLRVMRIGTASRRRRFVAAGSEPALSPDDRWLAYGAVPHGLAVRDLATGTTRSLPLTRRLGRLANLTLAPITWLGDGDDVAVVAPPLVIAAASSTARAEGGSCHAGRRPVVVFVHVPPAPAPLTAHCVAVRGITLGLTVAAASPRAPDVVRLASLDGRGFTVRDVASDGTVTPVLGVTRGIPLGFDPAGVRLLYVRSTRPPSLWTGRIASGRLTSRRELIPDSQVGAVAW